MKKNGPCLRENDVEIGKIEEMAKNHFLMSDFGSRGGFLGVLGACLYTAVSRGLFFIGQVALGSYWHHILDFDMWNKKYNYHLTNCGSYIFCLAGYKI